MVEDGRIATHVPHGNAMLAARLFGRAFRAGAPLRRIFDQTQALFGDVAWKTASAQRTLLQETVLYQSHLTRTIPEFCFGHSRCARFFRLLMDEVDRCSMGVVDESLAELAAQHCMMKHSPQNKVHVIHHMPDDQEVVLMVSERFHDLGARVWEAGICLSSQLFDGHSDILNSVKGASVLEIGAGTGLSAPAYVSAGAKRVLLTDYKQEIVDGIKENLRINNVTDIVQPALLDANDLPRLRSFIEDFDIDIITAADVTYDDDLVEIMVRAFADSISGSRVGYLLATDRNPKTTSLLRRELSNSGLTIERLFTSLSSTSFDFLHECCNIEVCTMRLSRGAL